MIMTNSKALRNEIRDQRRTLTESQRQHYSLSLCEHLAAHRLFQTSQRLAFYLPNDGEVDLTPLLDYAWSEKKSCYLPVLGPRNSRRLWFLPVTPDTRLYPNRYGIPEPVHARHARLLRPMTLDLVLLPLVAFDRQGHRVGMGGGFYDRTFAFRLHRRHWRQPRLVGIAYSFQQRDNLPHEAWDVPLDGIATEQGVQLF